MADDQPRFEFLMSADVGNAISESGVVENVEVDAETASKSISVQKLFLLPVS